jgi:hypothetical protein
MADSKITALGSIGTGTDPANDQLVIVDVSDVLPTGMATTGTTKRVSLNNLLASSPTATLASATITGDLTAARLIVTGGTIPTNGLWLPTTNTLEFAANSLAQYRIAPLGVFSWYDGAGGTRMTLNSTGLGLKVIPSGWIATAIPLQISSFTAAWQGSNGSSNLGFACYEGGSNTYNYRTTGDAPTFYSQLTGAHRWYTAASGTAGNAITFTQAMTLDASGNLLVGTTASGGQNGFCVLRPLSGAVVASTTETAHNFGSLTGTTYATYLYATSAIGSITQNGTTGVLYNITSDYRLKESVSPLLGGLARVNALKPSVYNWKSDGSTGEGFLAHELAEVVPFAVSGKKDDVNEDGKIKPQGIDMSRIVPILVAAIQELTAEVNALKNA